MDRTLTVVEDYSFIPFKAENILLWDSFEESDGVLSIPKMVEEQVMELRTEYLNWTATLASSTIDGLPFRDQLSTNLLNGGSYWWQTLIADKSPYRTKGIYNVLKVRVLEKKIILENCRKLVYVGSDKLLAKLLKAWLTQQNCEFSWIYKKPRKASVSKKKRLYDQLPLIAQAFAYIGYIILKRLRFSKHVKPDPDAVCSIVTYFPGIDLKKAKIGEFYSNYLGPLHNLLKQEGVSVNWIWMYSNMSQLSYKESVDFQSRLNKSSKKGNGRYLLLEDFLNFRIFWKGLAYYLSLLRKYYFYKRASSFFKFPESTLNFFAILKEDWKESFIGHTAVSNCMHMAAFHQASKEIPKDTKLMLYVWENQPWEQSLLSMRDRLYNTLFVGLVHTPANCALYNLKVFPGNTLEIFSGKTGRRIPDILAAPGDISNSMLVDGGWPSDRVQTFEALRYMDLINIQSSKVLTNNKELKILIITGSIQSETELQIEMLSSAEKKGALKIFSKILIKPHPLIPVESMIKKYKFHIPVDIVNQSLSELWPHSSVVFTSNSTSATVEAVYLGIPVIIMGSPDNLNINPLFGSKNVDFVYSVDMFCKKLSKLTLTVGPTIDFFELNPDLSRWKKLFIDTGLIAV